MEGLNLPPSSDSHVEIPAGKTIAIVGRSGSGKTTLVKCLAGLLEPTEGTMLFDGLDLTTLNYRGLRRQIGFVLQENYLFDDTILRNIAFGDPEPEMERACGRRARPTRRSSSRGCRSVTRPASARAAWRCREVSDSAMAIARALYAVRRS